MKKSLRLVSVNVGWMLLILVTMFAFCWFLSLTIGMCYALTNVTKPFNFGIRDSIKSTRFNANFDTLYNRINQTNDSLEKKFIRFNDFNDSTIPKIKVDTIRSAPDIDTIKGDTRFTGSPTIDGTLSIDSLKSTKGISASSGNFTNTISTTINIADTNCKVWANTTSMGLKTTKNSMVLSGAGYVYLGANAYADNAGWKVVKTGGVAGQLSYLRLQTGGELSVTTGDYDQYGVITWNDPNYLWTHTDFDPTTKTDTGTAYTKAQAYSKTEVNALLGAKSDTSITNYNYVDYSDTSTITGWSSFNVKQIVINKIGKLRIVTYVINGVSNSSEASFTVPDHSTTYTTPIYSACQFVDNGTKGTTPGLAVYASSDNKVFAYKTWDDATFTFTSSGVKIITGSFIYIAQ